MVHDQTAKITKVMDLNQQNLESLKTKIETVLRPLSGKYNPRQHGINRDALKLEREFANLPEED